MFCPNCSEKVSQSDKFCIDCGFELTISPKTEILPSTSKNNSSSKSEIKFSIEEKLALAIFSCGLFWHLNVDSPPNSFILYYVAAGVLGLGKAFNGVKMTGFSNSFEKGGEVVNALFNLVIITNALETFTYQNGLIIISITLLIVVENIYLWIFMIPSYFVCYSIIVIIKYLRS